MKRIVFSVLTLALLLLGSGESKAGGFVPFNSVGCGVSVAPAFGFASVPFVQPAFVSPFAVGFRPAFGVGSFAAVNVNVFGRRGFFGPRVFVGARGFGGRAVVRTRVRF